MAAKFSFSTTREGLTATLTGTEIGAAPVRVWNPSPSRDHRTDPYQLPRSLRIGIVGNQETAARFSPPPFAVGIEGDDGQTRLLNVTADPGWHRWNWVDFHVTPEEVSVIIDLEGHTDPEEAAGHIRIDLVPGEKQETRYALLSRALKARYQTNLIRQTDMPDWWRRPIYCGWGDQVGTGMWLEGAGAEAKALGYCNQGLYRRWMRRLDAAAVPFGTTIIDHGWSPAGSWEPDETRWPDMKKFIAEEHARGRRVLLWIATWLWDGLPDRWCVFAGNQKLTADPTNPDYLAYIKERIHYLLSPDGLNADGFKIDQLGYAPCQRRPRGGPRFGKTAYYDEPAAKIRLHQDNWGVELLHHYQKTIYDAAKTARPDALITSSTVHPLFADSFDMVRLHDTGEIRGSVLTAMKARSDLARATLPGMPVDADNWIHNDYRQWLEYTLRSHELGVPCIFYSERFVLSRENEPATRLIPIRDLKRIAAAWQ